MQRRNFIKTTICLACLNTLAGCSLNLQQKNNPKIPKNFNPKTSKFYYKSKNDLPKKIRLEACSLCQLNCPACTVRKLEKQAPKDWLGYLEFQNFKKFVDDNDFKEIELSNNGEIFLNPELDEIIKYAYQKNIKLTANNGINLNTVTLATLENLVKYQFKSLTISIDGATFDTYRIYRRGGSLNTVLNNIKAINQLKQKYNSKYPKLTYQFIIFGHNEHEIPKAKQLAKELGMRINFRQGIYDENYSPIKNPKLVEKQTGLILAKQNELSLACKKMFDTPQIDYNGNLLGCCFIQLNNFGINVFKEGLLNALNHPNFIYAKHMLTNLSTQAIEGIPCTNCVNYKFVKDENIRFF